jgi:hypothetical protein
MVDLNSHLLSSTVLHNTDTVPPARLESLVLKSPPVATIQRSRSHARSCLRHLKHKARESLALADRQYFVSYSFCMVMELCFSERDGVGAVGDACRRQR